MLRLLTFILLLSLTAACSSAPAEEAAQQVSAAASSTNADNNHADNNNDHADNDHADNNHANDGPERREFAAHEHGAAELFVAWSGNEVAVDLITPAFNILGFEYAPSSDEEKALLADSIAALESGELLALNSEADCALTTAVVTTGFDHEADDDDDHAGEAETHSEIEVTWTFTCEQADRLASLDVSALFAQFPNFEDLGAQWLSDTRQSAQPLSPSAPILTFE